MVLVHNFFNNIIIYDALLSLLESAWAGFSLFISVWSTFDFKLAKPDFETNLDIWTLAPSFKSAFVA